MLGSKCNYGLKDKAKRGATKRSILAELSNDPAKHEHWARSTKKWAQGAKPSSFPLPVLDTDAKIKEEVAQTESTAGQWIVPLRKFVPAWGEPIKIVQKKFGDSQVPEPGQLLFSTTMPPCKEVIAVNTVTSRRRVATVHSREVSAPLIRSPFGTIPLNPCPPLRNLV